MKDKKLRLSAVAFLLAAVMLISMAGGQLPAEVKAASSGEIKNEINSLEKENDKLQDEIDKLKDQINDNFTEMEKISAEKTLIDKEIFLLNQKVINVNQQITAYGLLIADKQDELDAAQARLRELSEKNKERIRAMEEDGNLSYWSVLFKANSFSDLLDRLNMIEEIAAADRRRLEEMSKAAEAVATARAELESEKAALEKTKVELGEMKTSLETKRVEADKLLAQLHAKGQKFDDLMDDAEAEAEKLQQEIAQKEKEYNEQKKKEEEASRPPDPNYGPGERPGSNVTNGITWYIPTRYTYLSSPYGWRVHPVHGDWRFHSGVDLAAPGGTPIYATRAGTVTIATYSDSAGYYVTVNHGDGFSSSYMHMTHYIVKPGQYVTAGQVIGYVGTTGTSTGNHLHFSIYYNGNSVNPASYVKFY
ncbi:MAG: peptidoglycan DD-metalloendopeptidase family protein [Oscillospiraceae bacterium]|nr:peptidoglycan DD-metalloendopeptidase family protein [Oscillospiraceae bacterium]